MKEILIKKDAIYSLLKSKITSGEYMPEYKFPKELDLCKELDVSRTTLRQALDKLEQAGLIFRHQGKGTFVSSKTETKTVEASKKFMILMDNKNGMIEMPSTYIVPSIIKICESENIETDLYPVDIVRSLQYDQAVCMFKKASYDGVFLMGSDYLGSERELEILRGISKPVVIPHAKSTDKATTGFMCIRADYKVAFADAVKHLGKAGHKNIFTIGLFSDYNEKNLRDFTEKEYLNFLASEGLNPDPELLTFIPLNFPGLTKVLADILKRSDRPSAVMCFSDFMAIAVYESLKILSMKIPEDIAVMGYCGYPGGHMMSPPVSTVDLCYSEIGKMALSAMNDSGRWFGSGKEAYEILSPHKLIIRKSTYLKTKG